jgi:hypothetical protein
MPNSLASDLRHPSMIRNGINMFSSTNSEAKEIKTDLKENIHYSSVLSLFTNTNFLKELKF